MESQMNSARNLLPLLPFPKRSIAVQVRLGTPVSIVFDLISNITRYYSILLQLILISRELLGKYLLFLTRPFIQNKPTKLTTILPYYRLFKTKLKSKLDVHGGTKRWLESI